MVVVVGEVFQSIHDVVVEVVSGFHQVIDELSCCQGVVGFSVHVGQVVGFVDVVGRGLPSFASSCGVNIGATGVTGSSGLRQSLCTGEGVNSRPEHSIIRMIGKFFIKFYFTNYKNSTLVDTNFFYIIDLFIYICIIFIYLCNVTYISKVFFFFF